MTTQCPDPTFLTVFASVMFCISPSLLASDNVDFIDFSVKANGASVWEFRYDNDTPNSDPDAFDGIGFEGAQEVSVSASGGSLTMDYALNWNPVDQNPFGPGAGTFVSNDFTVVNNTTIVQYLVVDASMPITSLGDGTPVGFPVNQGGEVSGSVLDANADGTAMLGVGTNAPLYEVFVDGVGSAELYNAPQAFTASDPGGQAVINTIDFFDENGAPNPTQHSIVLRYAFELSPGDAATINGYYFASQLLPSPGGLALLACAAATMRRHRRRCRS